MTMFLKTKALIMSLFVAMGLMVAPAFAEAPFTGFYVGTALSYSNGDAKAERNGSPLYGLDVSGAAVGLHAGYWHALGTNWRIGGEIAHSRSRADGADNIGNWYNVSVDSHTRIKSTTSARVQAGYVVAPRVMPYVFVGYERAKANVAETFTLGGKTSGLDFGISMKGPFAGLGVAYDVGRNWSVAGEISRHRLSGNFGDETFGAKGRLHDTRVSLKVNYSF